MSGRILTSGNCIQAFFKIKILGRPDTQIHAETSLCKKHFPTWLWECKCIEIFVSYIIFIPFSFLYKILIG